MQGWSSRRRKAIRWLKRLDRSLWSYLVWLEVRKDEAWREQQSDWSLNWHHHKFWVKVENVIVWLKIGVLEECKIGGRFGQIGGRFWVFFSLSHSTYFGAWFAKIDARFRATEKEKKNINVFLGWDLFQFLRDVFTINIDIVFRSQETRV